MRIRWTVFSVVMLAGSLSIGPGGGTTTAQAPAGPRGGLPDGPIEFEFEAYANNVRVVPPLVGEWQLGVSRFSGRGVIRDGAVTGTLRDVDNLRRGTRSLSARIVDGTYTEMGDTRRLSLRVEITGSSHPSDECAPGLTGLLELQDSPDPLPNGESNDWIRIGGWSGDCRTHVHGVNNDDGGPRTSPEFGGPPGGGQWAVVEIEDDAGGRVGSLGAAGRRIGGLGSGAPLDLIIAFDLTSSMGSSIESMKTRTVDLVRRAEQKSSDLRLGLVTYRDAEEAEGDGDREAAFWTRPLGRISSSELEGLMADWKPLGGGDAAEDMGEALSRAIAMWETEGSTARKPVKLVVVVTDAPGKWPDAFGNTRESIARRAYEVDPAHVYPVVVGGDPRTIEDAGRIAEMTGGRVLRAEEGVDVADAVLEAVEEGFSRHVAETAPVAVGGGGGGGRPVTRGPSLPLLALIGALLLVLVLGVAVVVARSRGSDGGPAGAVSVELSLEVVEPNGNAWRVDVRHAPVELGRDPSCDIVLDDPAVSRRHARIVVQDGELLLVDLASAAGILADDRIKPRARLWTGRELILGETRIRVLD